LVDSFCTDNTVLRGAGSRTALHAGAGRARVELAAAAGRARDEKFFVRENEC